MRTFTKIAATLGLVGTIAAGSVAPAAAFWVGHRHHYYNYGGDYGGPRWGVVSLTVRRPNTFEAASLGGLFFFNFNRARYRIAKNETSLRNFRSRIELLRLVWGEPEVPFDVRTSSAEFRCACIDVLQ
jgi:hypothetical protein